MGCHTWFSRPLNDFEMGLIKEYAPIEAMKLVGNTEENLKNGFYDEHLFNSLMRSIKEDIPCVDGKFYYWELGWGSSNPRLLDGERNFVYTVRGDNRLHIEVPEYGDLFRVENYPSKVIHNKRELRKFLKSRYFELDQNKLDKLHEFWTKYPDGVIKFG